MPLMWWIYSLWKCLFESSWCVDWTVECVQILNQKIHALLRKLLLKVQFINFHTNGEGGGRAGFWGEGGEALCSPVLEKGEASMNIIPIMRWICGWSFYFRKLLWVNSWNDSHLQSPSNMSVLLMHGLVKCGKCHQFCFLLSFRFFLSNQNSNVLQIKDHVPNNEISEHS